MNFNCDEQELRGNQEISTAMLDRVLELEEEKYMAHNNAEQLHNSSKLKKTIKYEQSK